MKPVTIVLTFGLLSLSLGASAKGVAHTHRRKPASEIQHLTAWVVMGEKNTRFEVTREGGTLTLKFANNWGQSSQRTLTKTDMTFLGEQFEKLPTVEKIPDVCARQRVEIVAEYGPGSRQRKASCLGTNTITEPKYRSFVNMLVLAL